MNIWEAWQESMREWIFPALFFSFFAGFALAATIAVAMALYRPTTITTPVHYAAPGNVVKRDSWCPEPALREAADELEAR